VKVFLKRNPADALGCRIAEGETGDVDANLGRQLVALGIADCLDPPPEPAPVVRAVPEAPAIAEARPVDIAPKRDALQRQQPPRKAAVLPVQPRNKKD
jgi:hypothetical protein